MSPIGFHRLIQRRETRSHRQTVRQMILVKANVAAVSWQIRLALLKDAKLGEENG